MSDIGSFPQRRMRRMRQHSWLRELVCETQLHPSDLILPVFVHDLPDAIAIDSMPDVYRFSIPAMLEYVREAASYGIKAVALFPCVDSALRNNQASEALNPDNVVCRAIRAIKDAGIVIGIIADVALDPYTDHGHDGIVEGETVLNDATIAVLQEQSYVLAQAGCDIVAPSDMMDGRIGAIRSYLDAEKQDDTLVLSYCAKYASSFYGPFRDAVGSGENLGNKDKLTYQMNPSNQKEALAEMQLDISEGADMVMVKPALAYLDIVYQLAHASTVPVLAYQVSGEYAMIKAAAKQGLLNEQAAIFESLIAMKRAGARAVFTYAALDVAKQLYRKEVA